MLSIAIAGNALEGERMLLVTDRGLYVSGETIYFNCTLLPGGTKDHTVSTIAYIELTTPNGEKILGQKRTIVNGNCKGSVTVPVEIISGNYYLRAYTKVMRNHPAETFAYCPLKIVNPGHSEILKYTNPDYFAQNTRIEGLHPSDNFQIEIDSDTIGTREEVRVKISRQETLSGKLSHAVVAIVPGTSRQQTRLVSEAIQIENVVQGPFAVESDGLTISGTTRQDQTETVNITLLEPAHNNFYPVKTDSTGRFSFALPGKYGEQNLFISFNAQDPDAVLLIDNDFCSKKIMLPAPDFDLNEEERNFLLQAAHQQKIKKYFGTDAAYATTDTTAKALETKSPDQFPDTIPFYGKPGHQVHISDYIQMGQLKDYLTELAVPVRVRKKGNEEIISITGAQAEMQIFPPLLMVDFAPIYNAGTILHMDPESVLRIDILDAPYVRGEMTYGGILNVISKKNDFAGIKLPEKGLFVNYQLLTDKNGFHNSTSPLPAHIPDTRSTLYWDPSFDFGQSDTRTFSILSSDMLGSYVIQVTGITSEGEMFVSEKQIHVVQ